jgi:hypothetical protein
MAFRWDAASLAACIADPAEVAKAFRLADTDGSGVIDGGKAVRFFGTSGRACQILPATSSSTS